MNYYVGVDVQTRRGCPFAILDETGVPVNDGWIEQGTQEETAKSLRNSINAAIAGSHGVSIAIDAPRTPLLSPRQWYWAGSRWRRAGANDRGAGRHCEIVIAAHRLAHPQWTPCGEDCPPWMNLGFLIFKNLESKFAVYEVFPSASYRLLNVSHPVTISMRLDKFAPGPKDMLDAYVAAATLREFLQDRGCEVGGGDGLGSIILPRPLRDPINNVLTWPIE